MIALPLPPSVNAMYRNVPGVGRVKTSDYKAWERKACAALTFASWDMPGRPYNVTLRFNVNHQSDIDNRVKPVLDLLVKHKVIDGDQWVNALHIYRDRNIEGCVVEFGEPHFCTIGEAANRVLAKVIVE